MMRQNILMTQIRSNLSMRLITAAIGAPVVLLLILASLWTTAVLLLVIFGVALIEYRYVVSHKPNSWHIYGWGLLYLAIPLVVAIWLRGREDGAFWLLVVLGANWMTDTSAYVAGRLFGQTPLAPRISPKKTWEGVAGGVVGGLLVTLILAAVFRPPITPTMWLLGVLIPIATVIGDLVESKFKRHYGVKDSGFLLPGHGGILDRIDGTLLAIPVAAVIVLLMV